MLLHLAYGCCALGLIQAQAIFNNINNNQNYDINNPNYNTNNNPNYNTNTNPNYNTNINPNYNTNINPNYNTNSDPNYNTINNNPFYNSNINPNYNNINRFSNDIFYDQMRCPEHWIAFQQSCYRFIRSPLRPYNEARRLCQVCIPLFIVIILLTICFIFYF